MSLSLSSGSGPTMAPSSASLSPSTSAPMPPPHPTREQTAVAPRRYHLFGFPISHSASPAFHNLILQSLHARSHAQGSSETQEQPCTYALCDTKSVSDPHLHALVRQDPHFAGSSVTMPLKVAVTAPGVGILDELSESARATEAVNTIVVLPGRKMLGTNTDVLGVRHALLRNLALQAGLDPAAYISTAAPISFPPGPNGKPYSGFVIGSGGTCRSTVYALHQLGLSPIYLLNRDADETQAVVNNFPKEYDLRPLRSVEAWNEEKARRERGEVGPIVAAVGAVPAIEPQSPEEKMVYTLVHLFFSESYSAFSTRSSTASSSSTHLPLPPSRPFLDMCYKPRRTPLLRFARESGWADIGGVEAMVEQGLAQARMWAASAQVLSLSLSGDAATEGEGLEFDAPQWATKAGDDGPLGAGIEQRAREMVSAMTDIVTPASVPAPAPAPAPAQRIAQAQQQLVAA